MDTISLKWKWLIGGLFFVVFTLAVFSDFIVSKGIEFYLHHTFSKGQEYQLSIEGLKKEKGQWVITNPSIYLSQDPDQTIFHATSLLFDYSFNFFNRELELLIILNEPEFNLREKATSVVHWNSTNHNSFNLIKMKSQFTIQLGHLKIKDKDYKVDGSISIGSIAHGSVHLMNKSETPYLSLNFTKDKNVELNLDCKNVECAELQYLLEWMMPEAYQVFIENGILNGKGGVVLTSQRPPIIHWEGAINHFVVKHMLTGLVSEWNEVLFDLKKTAEGNSSFGTITMSQGIFYSSFSDANSWEVKNLRGKVDVHESNQAKIALDGEYDNGRALFKLTMDGKASLETGQNLLLALDWTLNSREKKSSGNLHFGQGKSNQDELNLSFTNLYFQEAAAFKDLIAKIIPFLSNVKFKEGVLNSKMRAFFDQRKMSKLEIENLTVDQLEVDYLPLETAINIEHLSGKASLDFSHSQIEEGMTVQLNLENGKLFSAYKDTHQWVVSNIQSYLNFSKGRLIHSFIEASLEDMHGYLDIDADANRVAKLTIKGGCNHLFDFIQDNILRQKFKKSFENYQLDVLASLKRTEEGGEVIGLANILQDSLEKPLTFGFELSKSNSLIEDVSLYIEQLQNMLPSVANPLLAMEEIHWKNALGHFGYRIRNGWFHIADLPLEKYVAPFFVNQKKLKLEGTGNFSGRFDHQALMLTYEIKKGILENGDFALEVPEIKQSFHVKPVYYIDLNTGFYFGTIPLVNATFFEKGSGLLFTDINAEVVLEEKNIHVCSIESFCNGVYMMGNMDVDFKDSREGCFDLDMRFHALHGKLTQVQSLFSHFHRPFFFLKIPMEGDVSIHQDSGYMHFAFTPDNYDFQARIKGSLSDGIIMANNPNVALQDIGLNFEYDYKANILDFSEIQGTLLVGEPERVEEYSVVGEKVHFFDYANHRACFDFWVGDKKRDVIRVVGETYPSDSNSGLDYIQFALNRELSHFGDVHPSHFHLVLKDWWQVMEFRLDADIKLATLFQDLQRFSRTGLLFLSRSHLKQLNDIKNAEGAFNISIEYEDRKSQLDYHVTGRDVVVDKYAFNQVSLDGKKLNSTWVIDQLKFDDTSIAADILRKEESWLINFLGIRYGKSILVGLQGEYFDSNRIVKGKVNLLEISLDNLKEISQFQALMQQYPLRGDLKASGEFHYEMNDSGIGGRLDTLLNVSLKNGEFQELVFSDIDNVSCHFVSDKGIIFRRLNTNLFEKKTRKSKVDMKLEKLEYDIRQDQISIENLDFLIPQQNIYWTVRTLIDHFPAEWSSYLENLATIKKKGDLSGTLSVDYAQPHYAIKLALKDGEYNIFNKEYSISDFNLEYDPCEFKIMAKCHDHAIPFWILYKSPCLNTANGDLFITEELPAVLPANPLVIKWQIDPKKGFLVDQAHGNFHGMTFSLVRNSNKSQIPNTYFLNGEIAFDAKQVGKFISNELEEKITFWELGSGYRLNGQWEFRQEDEDGDRLNTYFTGLLEGKNFEFKGYQFDQLTAQVKFTPNRMQLQNLLVRDECGQLKIDQIHFAKSAEAVWEMNISNIAARDFKPSLLKKVGTFQPAPTKSLIIRQMDIENIQGYVGDINSFTGSGTLTFNNHKKNSVIPLFAIPSEILTRIGLDLAVLNPISGTIFYNIRDGKIYLTKLKDVYSQGKMSKFYLSGGTHQSYMDFEGNLNLRIKMKQYNLIFKFAELFTFTVQGNFQKPTYTLNKQQR